MSIDITVNELSVNKTANVAESTKEENIAQQSEQQLCPACDLVVSVPKLKVGQTAKCCRCHHTLQTRYYENPFTLPMCYAFCGLFMIILAMSYNFVGLNVIGKLLQIYISDIPKALVDDQYSSLAVFFVGFVLLIPVISMIIVILFAIKFPLPKPILRWMAKILISVKPWCMAEIFLVGVLVSFVKLMAYGEIVISISFAPFCLFSLLQIKVFQHVSRRMCWEYIEPMPKLNKPLISGLTGISQGVRLCPCCHAILPVDELVCPRCQTKGYARIRSSLSWTLALLATAIMLYVPANFLPIMETVALGSSTSSTIMSGVTYLWEEGSYPVAMVIFLASIMIPILKMLAIVWLAYCVNHPNKDENRRLHILYEIVEFVGRWSMIDIFVISVIAALVQMGNFMAVYPAIGSIYFSAVVIITMFSANMFDPRLIWDRSSSEIAMSNQKEN